MLDHLLKMEAKELQKNAEILLFFTVKWKEIGLDSNCTQFNFNIKTVRMHDRQLLLRDDGRPIVEGLMGCRNRPKVD
jgi:hypothetical protein